MNAEPVQLTFYDLIPFAFSSQKPKPLFSIGQTVYVVQFDKVKQADVVETWECGGNITGNCGYRLFYGRIYGVTWDFEIGIRTFANKFEAERKAAECTVKKIKPDELRLFDRRGFEYVRKLDNHKLTATFAKIGDKQLFERDFMCYAFLRSFKNEKERDVAYKKAVAKAEKENMEMGGIELESTVLEDLYYVKDGLYASAGYAEHHIKYAI